MSAAGEWTELEWTDDLGFNLDGVCRWRCTCGKVGRWCRWWWVAERRARHHRYQAGHNR